MSTATLCFLAQVTTTPATSQPIQQVDPPFYMQSWFPMALAMVFLYLIFFRPQKADKGRKLQLANLKRGDRVQTIGGVLGTVVEARDDEVVLKVDETNNTKMKFTRSAIHRVVAAEEAKGGAEK